ncbi:hypothetical protein G9A89_013223 [Geosiphon pyriformis]|nr:hypothetical protein G9A89_013223 [Geosiphon pyriformis]
MENDQLEIQSKREILLKSLQQRLHECDLKFNELLRELDWASEPFQNHEEGETFTFCPFDPAHKIPKKSYETHYKRCELKFHGIKSERGKRRQLPSSSFYYHDASSVVSLPEKAKSKLHSTTNVGQSLTVNERRAEYLEAIQTTNQLRLQNQQHKRDVYQNFDEVWELVQKLKEQNQGTKSRAELLAEQRDYKRRRKSYRAKNIKITQRTPTQIHHDIIAAYMEDFKLLREFEESLLITGTPED